MTQNNRPTTTLKIEMPLTLLLRTGAFLFAAVAILLGGVIAPTYLFVGLLALLLCMGFEGLILYYWRAQRTQLISGAWSTLQEGWRNYITDLHERGRFYQVLEVLALPGAVVAYVYGWPMLLLMYQLVASRGGGLCIFLAGAEVDKKASREWLQSQMM